MKTTILSITLLTLFVSCKKTYNCECKGSSTQSLIFTEHKSVTETSKKKAEESCVKKVLDYESEYNKYYTEKGVVIINCDLQ